MKQTLLIVTLLLTAISAPAQALRPYVYRVLSHEVIDGDSVRTELDLGFDLRITMIARVNGVDAPERFTDAGKAVTRVVRQWCEKQQTLLAVSVAKDKFAGRYLAELHGDHETLTELLLRLKLARMYHGEKRRPWTERELEEIERRAEEHLDRPHQDE